MELWQAFEKRTTVRAFSDRPVTDEAIVRAVRAALHAPAYNHLWEWGFIRLNRPDDRLALVNALALEDWRDREKLQRTFAGLPDEARKVYLAACPMQRTMMLNAPELVLVVYRTKRHEFAARAPADLNAHAAVWLGISHFLLALVEDGLYSCTVPPGPTAEAKTLLGLPEDWEIAALLPIGFPLSKPRRRPHPVDPAPFLHDARFEGFDLPTTDQQMD